MGKEIERKWLIKKDIFMHLLKEREGSDSVTSQGYLSVNPEVRIRSKINRELKETFVLCIKSKGRVERIEVEKELTKEEFRELMDVGGFRDEDLILKVNINVYVEGYKCRLSLVDQNTPTEFCYGEIEFQTLEEAEDFEAPEWFGEEVTNKSEYKMVNYWLRKAERLNK